LETGRLETFADGVFAIAATLLILELKLGETGSVTHQLLHLWPSYAAYAISFLTIGIIWVNHHYVMEQIGRVGSVNRFFVSPEVTRAENVARELSRAARLLAGSRHGALMVLERETGLHDLATESGVPLHADLRAELLVTIFYRGTALHDGAVLISGDRIIAAGVLLPLSQNVLDSERYGTRHRAAIGISEQTDALVVVVSEETGSISLVMRGRIERNLNEEKLRRRIFNMIRPQAPRRAVPLLRRTLEGRWGLGAKDAPRDDQPIDPEERVINPPPKPRGEPRVAPAPGERRP